MALPKIESPIFEIVIPSTNQSVNFRPFLVKEEKILLIAQQSGNSREVAKAVKQIVNNCCVEELDINSLAMIDLEYIFVKLRSRSVNNIVEVTYKDNDDGKEYKFEINLEEVNVVRKEDYDNKIKINDEVGIVLRLPSAEILEKMEGVQFDEEVDVLNFFVNNCISEIYDAETVYDLKEHSQEEIQEFVDNLDVNTFEKIRKFFDSAPKLEYVIEYTNSLGQEKKIVLDDLRDFFMLG